MIKRFIFLPFAGGSKFSYRTLVRLLSGRFDYLIPELPGRGTRVGEPLTDSMESLIDDLFEQIRGQLSEPYVLYGHSMGALLCFLLGHKIGKQGLPLPKFLVCTGSKGPSRLHERGRIVHLLEADAFWEAVSSFGALPDEILERDEYRLFLEPALRSDFKLIETYKHILPPLTIPILVINGSEEDFREADLYAWREATTDFVKLIKMGGGHFFIYGQESFILEEIILFDEQLKVIGS